MRLFGVAATAALTGLALLALAGCSDPASAPAREHASADVGATGRDGGDGRAFASRERPDGRSESDGPDPRDAPVPLHEGKPMWSATSRYTAQENAERAFDRRGEDFADAYVDAAHAFVGGPPADVLTLTRANGDRLLYAPGDNVFAVATREGAPRTFFKPDEGMAYWREQETREAERTSSGGERRADRRDGREGRRADDRG